MDDHVHNAPVENVDASQRFWEMVLRSWGIMTICVADLPQHLLYAELRDELATMHPIRRWLSFRKRRELQALRIQVEAAILNEVLKKQEERERDLA